MSNSVPIQEFKSIKDKYKYIIENYNVTSQSRFSELYGELFNHQPTQSTIAYNFKKYGITKPVHSGIYEFPKSIDNSMLYLEIEKIEQEIREILNTRNVNSDDLESVAMKLKQLRFRYKMSTNTPYEETTHEQATIETDTHKLDVKQTFQNAISDIIYSDKHNTLTLYLKDTDDVTPQTLCDCIYQYCKEKYKYISIIPCYGTVILYSINIAEILNFCDNIKPFYPNEIKGLSIF